MKSTQLFPIEPAGKKEKIDILLVDDLPANLFALEALLAGEDYTLVQASSGPKALRCVLEQQFALILLDVFMPGMDGFETAELIRKRRQSMHTPIIFITASSSNENHVSKGYSLGAVDYIYKPIVPEILKAKVNIFAELHRKTQELARELEARRESEEKYRMLFSRASDAIIVLDAAGETVLDANNAALKLYGYTKAEALGMSIKKLMPENKHIKAEDLVRVSAVPIETQRRTKSGRILDVLRTVTVLRDDKGQPIEVATTERDITEQKLADREFRKLHARVISAQETERKRIARELHDGIGQILSGVKYRLEGLAGKTPLSGEVEAKVLKVSKLLNNAISEIRRISQNLMPAELVDLGLEPALLTLCREFKERTGIKVTVRNVLTPAAPELELALYRIAQEALNNIGKHSKATIVTVTLSGQGRGIVLKVSDNGIGFKLGSSVKAAGRGCGLGNMRQRVESVGGSIEINSTPGAGTTVSVHVPLLGLGGDPT
jgi:PAS domain S-box-containing protein